MQKLLALGAISVLGLQGIAAQSNKKAQDIAAIKSMCGCYEVNFAFGETFAPDSNYHFHENHQSKGLEWVELVSETPNKLMLQHLLIVGEKSIVKHWRQDWLYENTDLYQYEIGQTWKFVQLPKAQVKGQWTQKVYQVDDSPRYEGSATWVHVDGRHFWENTSAAPLPRREHTTRNDYNVMVRRNRHELTSYGWVHEQDNDKVVRSEAGDKLIAQEKGWNTYRKVDNSRCLASQTWWTENQAFWAVVRQAWDGVFGKKQNLVIADKVENEPLHTYIYKLAKTASLADVQAVFVKFMNTTK